MADQQLLDDLDSIYTDEFFIEEFQHVNGTTDETLNVFFDIVTETVFEPSPVEQKSPQIRLRTSDMTNVDRDSVFTRLSDSQVYYPIQIGEDEDGETLIKLSEDQI